MYNMTETVESVSAHPVLRTLPAASDMMRKYTVTRSLIHNYEETMRAVWMNQNVRKICISLIREDKISYPFSYYMIHRVVKIGLVKVYLER